MEISFYISWNFNLQGGKAKTIRTQAFKASENSLIPPSQIYPVVKKKFPFSVEKLNVQTRCDEGILLAIIISELHT